MKVILIEDEKHKSDDLKNRICKAGVSEANLQVCTGVKQAVLAVANFDVGLIILDMALPTFSGPARDDGGGGVAQAGGGIEVLRALKSMGKSVKIIIVTQYPDILIDGRRIKLGNVNKVLTNKYGQSVLGAILYSYDTAGWAQRFETLIRRSI